VADVSRLDGILAGLGALAIVVGASLFVVQPGPNQRPVILSGTAVFPDHSAGQTVGQDRADEVTVLLNFATTDPWIQGDRHEIVARLDVTPGTGVASVDLTTLILYLRRPGSPHPDLLNSDLVLLQAAGANRWISKDGPLLIWPNQDVVGANFFLAFSVSLNVEYANGQAYGYGGWNPDVRIASPEIVPNLAPIGLVLMAAGSMAIVVGASKKILFWRGTTVNR
jgi:hypothetical protein